MSKPPQEQWIYQVAQISHELRTPLNAIKGFGDLLATEAVGPLNGVQKNYLQRMLSGADDLLSIINQILDWAKLSTGQLPLSRDDLNLDLLLREMQCFFELRAKEKDLTWSVASLPDAYACGDEGRLKQVLMNLIDNAFKFTPVGGQVALSLEARETDYVIRVQDSGIGMSEEVMERILEPFDTGVNVHEADGHGSGLGLWVSRAIVEAHGGELVAESKPQEGSIFTLTLPRGFCR